MNINQVRHKGGGSMRIAHRRTILTNPGPLVFGPQSRDPQLSFVALVSSGVRASVLCISSLLCSQTHGFAKSDKRVLLQSYEREEALVCFPPSFILRFAFHCHDTSDYISYLLSFLFPFFKLSCVDPRSLHPFSIFPFLQSYLHFMLPVSLCIPSTFPHTPSTRKD